MWQCHTENSQAMGYRGEALIVEKVNMWITVFV